LNVILLDEFDGTLNVLQEHCLGGRQVLGVDAEI
jgi:hypothetical protein